MNTHVFVVNEETFPIHLQYLFAGTGAKEEDDHIGLLSDIKRVRPKDIVLFYIEGTTKVKGGFYGVFRVADKKPIVFHTPGSNGIQPKLQKKLIYRTLIEPYEVYSEGVPEWEALDKLPVYATEIQWSLIYRKLKAKRGCTPLLPWEAERLIDMIRNKNSGKILIGHSYKGGFDWDKEKRKIILTQNRKIYSYPRTPTLNPLHSICKLQKDKRAYEHFLQLYFVENIGINNILIPIVGANIAWFGNEVSCGVGMQKIDILTICNKENKRKEYRIIELKDEFIAPDVIDQIEYYINWASQNLGRHLNGAFNWNIQPIIVAPKENRKIWLSVTSALKNYIKKQISLPILYFEFQTPNTRTIKFQQIRY